MLHSKIFGRASGTQTSEHVQAFTDIVAPFSAGTASAARTLRTYDHAVSLFQAVMCPRAEGYDLAARFMSKDDRGMYNKMNK